VRPHCLAELVGPIDVLLAADRPRCRWLHFPQEARVAGPVAVASFGTVETLPPGGSDQQAVRRGRAAMAAGQSLDRRGRERLRGINRNGCRPAAADEGQQAVVNLEVRQDML